LQLQVEYDEMVVKRKENDKQVEEVRDEANQMEAEHLKKSEAELNELLAEYWSLRLRWETGKYMSRSLSWLQSSWNYS
jgi:kinetochore protein Nuf2